MPAMHSAMTVKAATGMATISCNRDRTCRLPDARGTPSRSADELCPMGEAVPEGWKPATAVSIRPGR